MNRTKRVRLLVLVAMLLSSPVYAVYKYSVPKASLPQAPTVVIDQVNKEFIKQVTPVTVGTAVLLPNNDKIRHHVYSFSPAKVFEIPPKCLAEWNLPS